MSPQRLPRAERLLSSATVPALLLLTAGLAACHRSSSSSSTSTTTSWLSVRPTLTMPTTDVPLAAAVSVETRVPARVELRITDGIDTWTCRESAALGTQHDVLALGLRPDRLHEITVLATDANGETRQLGDELSLATDALPPIFPPIRVTVSDPARMEPGATLFNALVQHPSVSTSQVGFLVVLDEKGELVWLYRPPHSVGDARVLSNGNIFYVVRGGGAVEMDWLGNVIQEWWPSNLGVDEAPIGATMVATDSFHHDVIELPESYVGDFMALSSEIRTYPNYPGDEKDPSVVEPSTTVLGDVVVEFERDGTVVREWSLLDILDPYRISYGSLKEVPAGEYPVASVDWSHGNAVLVDERDDTIVVSLRSQDVYVKFRYDTGEPVWILGAHDKWFAPWDAALLTPMRDGLAVDPSDFAWPYHGHAPFLTSRGTWLLFDNGNGRAIAPAPELDLEDRYSRAVEFAIDETAGTVEQVWAYGGPGGDWYSGALGDADELPTTGNVLVVDGFKMDAGLRHARIVEVTRDEPAEVVFELVVEDTSPTPEYGWAVYRAERITLPVEME